MNSISSQVQSIITSQRSNGCLLGVCCTDHFPGSRNYIITFPNHSTHWSRDGKLDQFLEEWLSLVLCVVLLDSRPFGLQELHCNKLESSGFQLQDDLVKKAALDCIWLDHYERSLSAWSLAYIGLKCEWRVWLTPACTELG